MISLKKLIIKQLVGILLVGLMGFILINKSVYMHAHRLDNGKIIVHAHPFNKSTDDKPVKSHHHSKAELIFINVFNFLSFLIFLPFVLRQIITRTEYYFFEICHYYKTTILNVHSRAPLLLHTTVFYTGFNR